MNIHISKDIQDQFKCLEFRGRPFKYKNKHFMRALHKSLEKTMFYCFEDNFAWFEANMAILET